MPGLCLHISDGSLGCTLQHGHPGLHAATGRNGRVIATWDASRVQTWGELPKTDDGVGASPAASAETRTPSAQAGQDGRTPAPSSPRTFELVRHHDVSGQTGTGVVAEGVQFTDGTAALRWRGGHPATAVWPNVEEILAVHGHEGATELHWLDERTCRVCGCTDESACVGGCYWVAEDLCSQCGNEPVV